MAVLNLNISSSTTEEHHQTGYLSLPSEWKNKLSAIGVQRTDFCLLRWSETDNRDWDRGEIPDLDLEGMGNISIAWREQGGRNRIGLSKSSAEEHLSVKTEHWEQGREVRAEQP